MYFGINRTTDEQSLISFLQHFSNDRLTSELVPRMTDQEITQVIDLLSGIMKNHLTGDEYHSLFLGEDHHHG
jgi:hypothetical protein